LVVIECLKSRTHRGLPFALHFFRDTNGNEVDLIVGDGPAVVTLEIKSAATFSNALLTGLRRFRKVAPQSARAALIYRGQPMQLSDAIAV